MEKGYTMKIKVLILSLILLNVGVIFSAAEGAAFQPVEADNFPLPPHTVAMNQRRANALIYYQRNVQNNIYSRLRWGGFGAAAGVGVFVLPFYLFGCRSGSINIPTELITTGAIGGCLGGLIYSTFRERELQNEAVNNLVMEELQIRLLNMEEQLADATLRVNTLQRKYWWLPW